VTILTRGGPLAKPQPLKTIEGEVAAVQDTGDAAWWAHLVCPHCGAVVSEGHREGCQDKAP
jgi:hypothetical protein